ncbi:MAG TPA: helix-turn-helix domain-containing protein [Capillimicrobium sp.]|nr:helix-turn-helix domain-containing protein [Capillimicrobium sp.]
MDTSIDTRMAKAMAHPVRAEALRILNERVASPSDIARELELPVANVSYHVNTLHRLGCIEEVEHRHVRGAIEHRYRAVRRPIVELADSASLPANVRHSLCGNVFAAAMADAHAGLEQGTVERRADLFWTFSKFELDEQAWAEAYDVLRDAYESIEMLQAQAKRRISEGAEPIPSRLTIFHYEAPAEAAE